MFGDFAFVVILNVKHKIDGRSVGRSAGQLGSRSVFWVYWFFGDTHHICIFLFCLSSHKEKRWPSISAHQTHRTSSATYGSSNRDNDNNDMVMTMNNKTSSQSLVQIFRSFVKMCVKVQWNVHLSLEPSLAAVDVVWQKTDFGLYLSQLVVCLIAKLLQAGVFGFYSMDIKPPVCRPNMNGWYVLPGWF